MGSFSWLKADNLTNIANVVIGKPFKFLIPKEFGGGFIKDYYQDYGYLGAKKDGSPKYDMYELLAVWNKELCTDIKGIFNIDKYKEVAGVVFNSNKFNPMPEIGECTEHNRHLGIEIGCNDKDVDKLKYPLKLVSVSYEGTYENCVGRSYGDENQGWTPLLRNKNLKNT